MLKRRPINETLIKTIIIDTFLNNSYILLNKQSSRDLTSFIIYIYANLVGFELLDYSNVGNYIITVKSTTINIYDVEYDDNNTEEYILRLNVIIDNIYTILLNKLMDLPGDYNDYRLNGRTLLIMIK